MATLHPHINFNGNAEEAFTFYQSVLGGNISKLTRFKDLNIPGFTIPEHEREKIMHITLNIGNHFKLMGNDVPEIMGKTNENEHRSKIAIYADSLTEAEQLYHGLSKDGQVEMPLEPGPTGAYFAMFRDKYGIEWMISFE
jgi:PhnB protein